MSYDHQHLIPCPLRFDLILLLLILTPVARIIFAIVGFFLEKDYLYVAIGIIILSIILTSYFTQISG